MKKPLRCILVSIFFIALLGLNSCGYEPLSEAHSIYAGKWTSSDGTWVRIYLSGQGDFDLGNQTLSGGKVEITEDIISMEIMGIQKKFTITEPPTEKDGNWIITLDGIKYSRVDGP